jgi:hypothetical protein
VLQQPLAVGGGAVLVDNGLRLPHQELREQDAAFLEDLCKTVRPAVAEASRELSPTLCRWAWPGQSIAEHSHCRPSTSVSAPPAMSCPQCMLCDEPSCAVSSAER